MAEPIRLVLVEDNQVFREALELLLGLQSDIEVVASVGDGSSAAEIVRAHQPDVVLMDYRLPGLDGVQATRAVLEACPDVAVVCLTASANFREVDALYEDSLHRLTADTSGFARFVLQLGPFGGSHRAGASLLLWAAIYLLLVGALALAAFSRRDL